MIGSKVYNSPAEDSVSVRLCLDCSSPLGRNNKTGRCRRHAAKVTNADPVFQAARLAGIRARFKDPEVRRRAARDIQIKNRLARRDPETKARLSDMAKARARLDDPEVKAKWRAGRHAAGQRRSETVMAWCPPQYRDLYRYLKFSKKLLAAEAKAAVLAQIPPFELRLWRVRNGAAIYTVPLKNTLGGIARAA